MTTCDVCGERLEMRAFECNGCGGVYCSDHRSGSAHDCRDLDDGADYDVIDPDTVAPKTGPAPGGPATAVGDDGGSDRPDPTTGGFASHTDDERSDDGDQVPLHEGSLVEPGSGVTPHCPHCGASVTSVGDVNFIETESRWGFFRASKRFYVASCGECGETIGTGVAGAKS